MLNYAARRLLVALPILVGVTLLAYVLITMMPGDPITMMLNPNELDLTSVAAQQQRLALGLDKPLAVRFLLWLAQAIQGNLGYSYTTGQPVLAVVLQRLLGTAELVVPALIVAVVIAVIFGAIAATHRGRRIDHLVCGLGALAVSLPSFFLGLGGIYLFSLKLDLLPTAGKSSLGAEFSIADYFAHLVLPMSVLALASAAELMRYVRGSLLDVLGADFLRTARAKGLSPPRILFAHALRNGLLPVVTAVGVKVPQLLGGAVITETIFQWPGIGMLSVQAVSNRDYAVLMGVLLVAALVVMAANLATDLLYARIDPRVRLRGGDE